MSASARLLLLAALPALAGVGRAEVVSLREGPSFVAGATRVEVARDQPAELACSVRRQGDTAVSWVRSRDVRILAHGGAVFADDARVSVRAERVGPAVTRHTLRLERPAPADAGRYECQLNTDPKTSLFFELAVLDEAMPRVEVAVEAREVRAAAGGAATLACRARYVPAPRRLRAPPLAVRWSRGAAALGPRAGVALDTERWEARAHSTLTLTALRPEDAGEYRCAVADVAAAVTLLVDPGGAAEAMQADAGGGAARGARAEAPPLLLLALLLGLVPR